MNLPVRYAVISACSLLPLLASAQVGFGAKGGVNYIIASQTIEPAPKTDPSTPSGLGFQFGGFSQITLSDNIALRPELIFSFRKAVSDQTSSEPVTYQDQQGNQGNGTQTIFYDRSDVVFASLHGHPQQEYPYFLGWDDETGVGAGEGANRNWPLRHGTAWDAYGAALDEACAYLAGHRPDVLVVSLGVDTFKDDPISKFRLEHEDYLQIGARIAGLGLPTLVVFEGGYAVSEIGINAVNVLEGMSA